MCRDSGGQDCCASSDWGEPPTCEKGFWPKESGKNDCQYTCIPDSCGGASPENSGPLEAGDWFSFKTENPKETVDNFVAKIEGNIFKIYRNGKFDG
jgi:hypothetical protein